MLGFLTGGISKYIIIGLVVALAITAGAFSWYFNSAQNTIATLNRSLATSEANVVTLKQATQEQNDSILLLESKRAEDQRKMDALAKEKRQFSEELAKLRSRLDHDFYALTLSKPKWMEKLINKGSKQILRDLENTTKHPEEGGVVND